MYLTNPELLDSTVIGDSMAGQLILRLVLSLEDPNYPPPPVVMIQISSMKGTVLDLRVAVPITVLNMAKILPSEEGESQHMSKQITQYPTVSRKVSCVVGWRAFSTICPNPRK